MSTPLDLWLDALGHPAPTARLQTPAKAEILLFDGPLGHPEACATLLEPLILQTLPGYGSGRVAGICMARAAEPAVVVQGAEIVGFVALDRASVDGVDAAYLTLTALSPSLQGQGVLRCVLEARLDAHPASVLAATTNVPGLVRLFEKLALRTHPFDGLPIAPELHRWGRRLLAEVLDRGVSFIELDGVLVRRKYRTGDLQSEPSPDYHARLQAWAEARGDAALGRIIGIMGQDLKMGVGDAVLVLSELDDQLAVLRAI